MTGLLLLAASVAAGVLWSRSGASATFLGGAGLATLALATLLVPRTLPGRRGEGA